MILDDSFVVLLIARIIAGFGAGISAIIVPLYITEITTDAIRGRLGVVMISAINMGTFIMYLIGPKLAIGVSASIVAIPLLYTLTFFYYLPESPLYYLLQNDNEGAERCLRQLRCSKTSCIKTELESLKHNHFDPQSLKPINNKSIIQSIVSSNYRKGLIICLVLFTGHVLCGSLVFIFFPHLIFDKANGIFSANTSALIFSGLQFLSSIISSFYVDSWGRKPLLIISCFGCAFATFAECVYFYLQEIRVPFFEKLSWTPLINAVALQVFTAIGLAQVPTIFLYEIFPAHLKAIYGCLISMYFNLLMFLIIKSFQFLIDYLQIYVVFLFFSIINVCTGVFTVCFVPETKGQSFQEIRNKF